MPATPAHVLTKREADFLAVVAAHAAADIANGAPISDENLERWMRGAIAKQVELLDHVRAGTETGRAIVKSLADGVWRSLRAQVST